MMKRLFVVGAVVMLAAAFFGCVEQAAHEDAPEGASEYDAQGRRLVTFNIPTRDYNSAGGGVTRALTKPLAQTTWDYVEVVFKNDTEYYAGAAARGKDMYFTLPVGEYHAVMFAGVGRGTRLLAVGVPTAVDGSDAQPGGDGSITITANTKKITFSLCALTTDIVSGASFTVDGASVPGGVYAVDGTDVPVFLVQGNEAEIRGTFKIGGFTVGTIGVSDDGDLFNATGLFGALGAAGSSSIIQAIGTTSYDSETGKLVPPLAVDGEVKEIGITGGVLEIGFALATNVMSNLTAGFSRIWFDVPIQAFTAGSAAAGRGSVWHIVNGLEAVYDLGGDSVGENILLYTGDTYYVSASGSDANHGMTEDKPFATLAKAAEAAMDNSLCKAIVVLTDLEVDATVTITGGVNKNVVTVRSKTGGTKAKVTKTTGNNESVIQIENGAKVSFERIKVDGKYSDPVYNRGLYVTGAGTAVTLGADAVISGKLTGNGNYGGGVYVDGGTFEMWDDSEISDSVVNTTDEYGGGVSVNGGTFTMWGGEISRNTTVSEDEYVSVYGSGVQMLAGMFTMKGGTISENKGDFGSGVYVVGGAFNMTAGTISENKGDWGGDGVYVVGGTFTMEAGIISKHGTGVTVDGGTFDMNDGTISGSGGGVYMLAGTFNMKGGTISENTTYGNGGGVYMNGGAFTMSGGTISENTTYGNGGGVYVNAGAFTMTGGAISKSTASRGGGVYVSSSGTFTKAAGIIYGNDASDPLLANTATSGTGHAVYAGSSKKRDATADATVPLDSGTAGAGGGWD